MGTYNGFLRLVQITIVFLVALLIGVVHVRVALGGVDCHDCGPLGGFAFVVMP